MLCRFGHTIIEMVERISSNLSVEEISEREDLLQQYLPTMHACYNFGFEVSTSSILCLCILFLSLLFSTYKIFQGSLVMSLFIRS